MYQVIYNNNVDKRDNKVFNLKLNSSGSSNSSANSGSNEHHDADDMINNRLAADVGWPYDDEEPEASDRYGYHEINLDTDDPFFDEELTPEVKSLLKTID
jgi:hypothetical protein